MINKRNNRKGQMNIDYIISLGVFILVLMGTVTYYNSNFGKFMSRMNDLGTRMSGLYVSYRAYSLMVKNNTLVANKTFVSLLKECSQTNSITERINAYETLRKLLSLSVHQEVFLKGTLFVIGYSTNWNYVSPSGIFYINNTPYFFKLVKSNSNFFNTIEFSGKNYSVGDTILIDGQPFEVYDIDPYGYFIILEKDIFSCGVKPNQEKEYTTRYFYVNYNNNILEVMMYVQ